MKNNIFATRSKSISVQEWQFEFEWLRVRHGVKDLVGKKNLPDLNAILMLIGIQELGKPRNQFTKEEKQDLMHIAVCTLLMDEGYFEFKGLDADGWPHFEQRRHLDIKGVKAQERMLKEKVIEYFAKNQLLPQENDV